jgi:magnesium-transporting ATPase (P-type)
VYLINCRSLRHSVFAIGFFRNGSLWLGIAGMLLLQAGITYLPFLNALFQTAPIGLEEWLRIGALSAAAFVVVEVQKALVNRRSAAGAPPRGVPAASRP